MNKFAEQLNFYRRQKGLSQEDLADKLHISRQAISFAVADWQSTASSDLLPA